MLQNNFPMDLVYSTVKGAVEAKRDFNLHGIIILFHGMMQNVVSKELAYSIVEVAAKDEWKFMFHGILQNNFRKTWSTAS